MASAARDGKFFRQFFLQRKFRAARSPVEAGRMISTHAARCLKKIVNIVALARVPRSNPDRE
jgi:hypothetical protein